MSDQKDPLAKIFDVDEVIRLRKENEELRARLAPVPAAPLSAHQKKQATEARYAHESRRETANVTRGGIKFPEPGMCPLRIPARGSGNCADYGTKGREGFTSLPAEGETVQ